MHPDRKAPDPQPPSTSTSSRGKRKLLGFGLLFLLAAVCSTGAIVWLHEGRSGERKILYYVSPMDPGYRSDKPGKAPCGMDLVPVYEGENPSAQAAPTDETQGGAMASVAPSSAKAAVAPEPAGKAEKDRKILYYVDPMNPTQKSDKPGKAPCGMDLVPVYDEASGSSDALPPGTIRISAQKQQLIGVKTGEVSERKLSKTVRTVGRVSIDETRVVHVHSTYKGWIKKVYVDFTGKAVKKDEPLVTLASPDFVSDQQDLLIARRSMDALKASSIDGMRERAAAFYESAKERLRANEVSEDQIREIEARNAPFDPLTLRASIDGFVVARHAFEGEHVALDTELYAIADVSKVWVLAEVYEYEMDTVKAGQPATVSLPYSPGRVFEGTIDYVYPKLDPKTRTLKVRIELPNPELQLKPDMFADVDLTVDYGTHLAVPADAVLDSGTVQTVFVAREGGLFEPRQVKLGQQVNDSYIVLDGLKAGERIVTSAHFLIDSESQIKSAASAMSDDTAGSAASEVGRHSEARPGDQAS